MTGRAPNVSEFSTGQNQTGGHTNTGSAGHLITTGTLVPAGFLGSS